jgi:DNA processing protein
MHTGVAERGMTEGRLLDAAEAVELTLVPEVGSAAVRRLSEHCRGIAGVFALDACRIAAFGIPPTAAAAIRSRHYRPLSEEICDWCRREGYRLLVRGSSGYPALLDEIYDPPLVLYARGDPKVLEAPALAIVGTRRPTPYGLQMAEGLACDLARRGILVVSGLARGIDAAAHRGCLEAGGRTVAVLGNGIDVVYPGEHRQLTERIRENGLLLSEFPPGTSPAPQNFPIRNRIISGLSLGTLIVEASEYSGSLITGRLAMEQDRELFALPGNITTPQSFGPNFLLKQGAKLVQSWRDIVEEFPPELRSAILGRELERREPSPTFDLLDPEERRILDLLESDRAAQFDKILTLSGASISKVSDALLNLETQGWIRQLPGSLYVRRARPPQ